MARVVVIDDYQQFAEMAAGPLRVDGHEVLCLTSPIDVKPDEPGASNTRTGPLAVLNLERANA